MSSLPSVVLCLVALASPAIAQGRVWIVDAQNGPGTHFTDLPAAVAAAGNGDVIRIRVGSYSGTTIGVGLTVLGGAGVQISPFGTGLTVTNLPAGRQVVLQGVVIPLPLFGSRVPLTLAANQGRVLLDRIAATGGGGTPGITITDSVQVQINQCRVSAGSALLGGGSALNVVRSTVALSETAVVGAHASPGSPYGSWGLQARDARIHVAAGTTIDGGSGIDAGTLTALDMAAIDATNAHLVLCGDSTTRLRAGQAHRGQVPAIAANGGTVTIDQHVILVSNATGVPAILGTATVTTTWLPSLAARGAAPGAILSGQLFSQPGDVALFLTSLPGDPIDLGSAGLFWIDPNLFLATGVGLTGGNGYLAHSIALPNDPALSSSGWALQALAGTFAGGFEFSNPVGYALVD